MFGQLHETSTDAQDEPMVVVTLRLSPAESIAIQKIAARRRETKQAIYREAIRRYLLLAARIKPGDRIQLERQSDGSRHDLWIEP